MALARQEVAISVSEDGGAEDVTTVRALSTAFDMVGNLISHLE